MSWSISLIVLVPKGTKTSCLCSQLFSIPYARAPSHFLSFLTSCSSCWTAKTNVGKGIPLCCLFPLLPEHAAEFCQLCSLVLSGAGEAELAVTLPLDTMCWKRDKHPKARAHLPPPSSQTEAHTDPVTVSKPFPCQPDVKTGTG